MIETKMDPLAASFAAMEQAPHEEAAATESTETDQTEEQSAVDKVAEHIAAVKRWMDAHTVASARPALEGTKSMPRAQSDFTAHYLRRGLEIGLERKSFDGTSGAAGGYAVPQEIDAVIDRTLNDISPIRGIANVVKVGSAGYRKLVTTGGTPSGWVAEDAARPETDTPDFAEIAPPMGELYANPAGYRMGDDGACLWGALCLARSGNGEISR